MSDDVNSSNKTTFDPQSFLAGSLLSFYISTGIPRLMNWFLKKLENRKSYSWHLGPLSITLDTGPRYWVMNIKIGNILFAFMIKNTNPTYKPGKTVSLLESFSMPTNEMTIKLKETATKLSEKEKQNAK